VKVLVTGANGHLGRRLIPVLAGGAEVCAVVRSAMARKALEDATGDDVNIAEVDYGDAAGLRRAGADCEVVVHLVGIIRESRANPYRLAHEDACRALADAVAGTRVRSIVYVSLLGADATSSNACFASRGRAERILLEAGTPVRILRVPMVLGEGDYASRALDRQARGSVAVTFRSASLEQPIYSGDLVSAIVNSLGSGFDSEVMELAGPESLSRGELIRRAARILGNDAPLILSLPLAVGLLLAAAAEALADPPVTRAMLGVLDHDDHIDPAGAAAKSGISLTPLDEMLRRVLRV
jgi:uncharacterized protein YbjT (DUF2867 family)